MFKQVWKDMRVRWNSGLNDADLAEKVDADAVLVPERIRKVLLGLAENKQVFTMKIALGVEYGCFGNLEVALKNATKGWTRKMP